MLQTNRSTRMPWCLLLVLGLTMAWAPAGRAQEQAEDDPPAPAAEAADAGAETVDPLAQEQVQEPVEDEAAPPPRVAESERILRLEEGLEADRATLAALVGDTAKREELFTMMGESEKKLIGQIAELENQGEAPDEEELAELRAQLQRLKSQADITLQSIKTMRTQRETLEKKVAQDELARQELLGLAPPKNPEQDTAASSDTTTTPAAPETKSVGIPGMPPLPTGGTTPSDAAPAVEPHAQTAEQIEADQEAAKLESRAMEAEQQLVGFMERKAALEEQISLQGELLGAARASRDNLLAALDEREKKLSRLVDEGADDDLIEEEEKTLSIIREMADDAHREIDQRNAELQSLHARLKDLHDVRLAIEAEAGQTREEAEDAKRRSIWLKSPLHPQNIAAWAVQRGPRILMVVMVAAVALLTLRLSLGRIARAVIRKSRDDRSDASNRANTLASSFRSAGTVLIVLAGMLLVLEEAGLDIQTVLGGAAILGVAIAFGAQNLMRDYFTGFLILLEDQFEIGDLVTIGNITGTVERVNMRTTMLRDLEGRMHFIPNGEIKSITNRTYIWGRAVFEIPVSFDEDVERVMKVLLDVAEELTKDPEFGDGITDDPQMLGVDKFTESGVIIKFMLRTSPEKMFVVRREMLRRVKNRFDELGIRISVPHRVMVAAPRDAES